jgi:acyl-CoA synthetase (AMP-forming)/AMP-acid ligase II
MLRGIAGHAGVSLVLADAANQRCVEGVTTVDLLADDLLGEPLAPVVIRPDDVAIHLSTSGSTGTPKGALLSHRSQLFTLESWATVETSHTMERTLVAAPLFHKNGLGETKLGLWLGAEVLLQRRFDPRAYLEAAAAYRCTTLSGVPTMFAMMLEHGDLLDRLDLGSVVGLEIGSAPFSEALLERVREVFPRATIYNSYGTTEVAAIFGGHPDGVPAPRTSVGFPLPTVELRLVGEHGEDANPGELWVRGEGVMNGYHDAPDLTAAKIVDGWCRTGDVMFRDDEGWYHFVGRVDDMFVSGGENVYPMAIEQVLEQHPLIRQAAVVAVPDERKGALPVAFVVASPGGGITEDDVQRWSLAHLPPSHHPRAVWFVDALPLAGTEKIDRRALETEAARRSSRG